MNTKNNYLFRRTDRRFYSFPFSSFNSASFCGVTSWSSGSETSIAGKTCQSTTFSSVNDGFKDIVQMNSERTYIRFGNTSDLESDGYPSTVYANKYYKFN